MENDGKVRMLRLLELLETESDEEHMLTIADITAELESRWGMKAHRITVQNDVASLIEAGYDIETVRSSQNKYYLASRRFELPELKLLLDAVESSKFITQKKSGMLVSEILSLTSRHKAAQLKRNISIADRIKPSNEHIYYYIDAINDAINAKKKIEFLYCAYAADRTRKLKNDGEPYVLSPYTLTWNGDFYYVVGWSDKHEKVAAFRVERIYDTPMVLDEDAAPIPEDYTIAEYAEKAFRLFDGERTVVKLLCDESAMNSVVDHFGENAETEPLDDRTFLLTAEVSLSPTFFAWVFQFGGKVKILEPEKAKTQFYEMLRSFDD